MSIEKIVEGIRSQRVDVENDIDRWKREVKDIEKAIKNKKEDLAGINESLRLLGEKQ